MSETYIHQQSDGNIMKYSDKPVKFGGVTIKPRWAWSEDYKRWARRPFNKGRTSPNENAYRDWYYETHGKRCPW
jgi:hypothetical protein